MDDATSASFSLWHAICAAAATLAGGIALDVMTRLSDKQFTREFWASEQTASVMRRYDFVANLVILNNVVSLLRKHAHMGRYHHSWASSPWRHAAELLGMGPVLQTVFLALAVVQLAWLLLRPRSYSRHRGRLLVLGRLLRCVGVIAVCCTGTEPSRIRDFAAMDVGGLSQSGSHALATAKLLLLYSCALHSGVHSLVCLLPTAHSARIGVFNIAVIAYAQSGFATQFLEAHPGTRAVVGRMCRGMWSGLDAFFGFMSAPHMRRMDSVAGPGGSENDLCSRPDLRAAVVAAQVVVGCLAPLAVTAAMEARLKEQWLRQRLAEEDAKQQQQQQQQLQLQPPPQQQQHRMEGRPEDLLAVDASDAGSSSGFVDGAFGGACVAESPQASTAACSTGGSQRPSPDGLLGTQGCSGQQVSLGFSDERVVQCVCAVSRMSATVLLLSIACTVWEV